MDNTLTRALIAEFLGTFTLVFVGAFAVVTIGEGTTDVVTPALAHGLILIGLIFTFGHISGAHFNPAVTVGLFIGGNIDTTKAIAYLVIQFVGGIVAAYVLVAILPDPGNYGQTTGSLTADNVWNAVLLEVVLTFFLVSSIYQSAVYGRAGTLAAVAIGMTLAGAILAGGPYSGASLNPARTLGPALAAGDFSYLIPYLIGTFGGGVLAGVVHAFVLTDPEQQPDVDVA